MAVADVAWQHMTPAAQARAGVLLKLNPLYAKWIADAALGDEDRTAFLRAATWADEIKHTKGYRNDGYTPADPHSDDMTDYTDMSQHKGGILSICRSRLTVRRPSRRLARTPSPRSRKRQPI